MPAIPAMRVVRATPGVPGVPGWLVVNADDLGVSKGATLGIVKAHREGVVTSASLAPTTPFYTHAVESCVRTCPDLGIGLHFTLTSGAPVSAANEVPLLVDGNGQFRWRFVSLLVAVTIRKQRSLLDQIEREIDAQFGRLHRDGIRPDHVNGERHVHLIPGIFELVVAAARRHGVPFIRVGREFGGRFVTAADTGVLVAGGGFAKSWLLSSLSTRNRAHIGLGAASPDYVASYMYTGRIDAILPRLLAAPAEPGVTEVMVHPGIPDENGPLALGNRELERYLMSDERRAELTACVAARGATTAWQLTNYRLLGRQPGAQNPS